MLGNEQRNKKFEYANVKYGSIIFKNKNVITFQSVIIFLDPLYI